MEDGPRDTVAACSSPRRLGRGGIKTPPTTLARTRPPRPRRARLPSYLARLPRGALAFLSLLGRRRGRESPRSLVGFFRRGEVPCALSSALRMRPCPSKHGRAARFAPQPNVPLGVRARGAGSEHAGLAGWFGRLRGSASPALRHVNPTLGPNGWQAGMAGAGGQGEDWPSAPTATEERANPPRLQGTSGRGTCVPPGPANSPGRNRWREGQQQQQQPHVPP